MNDNTANNQPSSHMGTVLGLARTLKSYDLDPDEIFAEAGVDLDTVKQGQGRIPSEAVNKVIKLVMKKHVLPCFGLHYASNVFPLSYDALGAALMASSNLRDFCERLAKNYSFINTNEQVRFEETEQGASLIFKPNPNITNAEELNLQCSGSLATWLNMIRMMYKPDYHPSSIALQSADPGQYISEYETFFGCPISFSEPVSAIHFSKQDLDTVLPGSNLELARVSDKMVMKYLTEQGSTDFTTQVRLCLLEQLPRGEYSLNTIAEMLYVSPDELNQSLLEEDTSLAATILAVRQELVLEYIVRKDLSISEVAYLLGFSDCSNFSRSFKLWHGVSPSDYREKNLST